MDSTTVFSDINTFVGVSKSIISLFTSLYICESTALQINLL